MNKDKAGLCFDCRFARLVENRRGSAFLMCERAKTDPEYVKYPHLPVALCKGYEEGDDIV